MSASTFLSGMSRLELLMRTARILEGLAASKHAGGAPQDALALRLITIQVSAPSQGRGCIQLSERTALGLMPFRCCPVRLGTALAYAGLNALTV